MKPEFYIALWGALTGSIACLLNLRQSWHDRANLKIDATMAVINDERGERVAVTVSVVNLGRRQASIKKVAIPLSKEHLPIPAGLTEEQREKYLKLLQGTRNNKITHESELAIVKKIDVTPDGGHQEWELEVRRNTKLVSKQKEIDLWGKGYIELTSGKKRHFKFIIIPEDRRPPDMMSRLFP